MVLIFFMGQEYFLQVNMVFWGVLVKIFFKHKIIFCSNNKIIWLNSP